MSDIFNSKGFNDAGTSIVSNHASDGLNPQGTLEQVGSQLNGTIDKLSAKLDEVMATMTNGAKTSDPQTIALYQQVYGEYIQANSVRASAVEKMQSLIDRILQKT